MIDIRRLLSDEQYKKYLLTTPRLPAAARLLADPWYVYLQRESGGPWARGRAATYREAMVILKRQLSQAHDIVVVSRRVAFDPPMRTVRVTRGGRPVMVDTPNGLQPKTMVVRWDWRKLLDLEGGDRPHLWCPYCRRPTEFRYFPRHHAFRSAPAYRPDEPRCTVCGVSESLARGR